MNESIQIIPKGYRTLLASLWHK